MAYGVDEYGNDLGPPGASPLMPPFLQSRDEAVSKMAAQRSLRWRQRAQALADGLAASQGASNFGESLLAGLSGGLAGGEKFATGQWERDFNQNRQNIADQATQQELAIRQQTADQAGAHYRAEDSRAPSDPYKDTLARLTAAGDYNAAHPDAVKPSAINNPFEAFMSPDPKVRQAAIDWQKLGKQNPAPEDNSWTDGLVITTHNGKKFMNVDGLTGKDKSAAMRRAIDLKIPAVGTKGVAQLQDIESARRNLDSILGNIGEYLPKGATQRAAMAPGIKLSQLAQTSGERASYGSWRQAAIRTLRATAGTTGLRINQKEIDLAVKNDIPELTDTWEVAQKKLDHLKVQLDNAENPLLENDWSGGAATTTDQSGGIDYIWDGKKLVPAK